MARIYIVIVAVATSFLLLSLFLTTYNRTRKRGEGATVQPPCSCGSVYCLIYRNAIRARADTHTKKKAEERQQVGQGQERPDVPNCKSIIGTTTATTTTPFYHRYHHRHMGRRHLPYRPSVCLLHHPP